MNYYKVTYIDNTAEMIQDISYNNLRQYLEICYKKGISKNVSKIVTLKSSE